MAGVFERLAIPLRRIDGSMAAWWVIEATSSELCLNPDECSTSGGALPRGWKGKEPEVSGADRLAPIEVAERAGQTYIRLLETRGYEWSIENADSPLALALSSSLKGSRICNWKSKQSKSGSFKVINHLGLADFELSGEGLKEFRLHFEFISQKFDFDSEYRRLTEDIAGFCQQLLLSWEAPTRLRFSADPNKAHKLLLEQFLFLKSFMTGERLGMLFEAIRRNPHSILERESEWVTAAAARSSDYLSNPCGMLRDWRRKDRKYIPGEVRDVRKSDTHDTAPNRFIKFALTQFRQICAEVCVLRWSEDGKPSTIGLEAREMLEKLDGLLFQRFFNEVGRMQRLPLDNQTLQKREGYREVLQAWLLTQAATTLNWQGEKDCYEGDTRDVATLYEYWIFIKLHELLRTIPGLTPDDDGPADPDHFISEQEGQLCINLSQGHYSRSRFIWRGRNTSLRVDLQYERSFSSKRGATSSGSYSRRFRPDYTLSIYPEIYADEAAAEAQGKLAHIHLDAKYRAENIKAVFGDSDYSDQEISAEKLEGKSEQSYKRGDLLKMHTYSDALRHTIGSYVLYPGTKTDDADAMRKFHEIVPGVGALVMKPGNNECLETIRRFIMDILTHQADMFSQYRYLSDTSHKTHRDEPGSLEEPDNHYNIARKDAPCVVLWLRKNEEPTFRKNGFAYCRAIPEAHQRNLNLNLSIEIGSEFVPCSGGQGTKKLGYGWRAKVEAARFISREKLQDYIRERGLEQQLNPSSVDHYLLFEFTEATPFKEIDLTETYRKHRSGSDYMAISCQWRDILVNLE